MRKWSARIPTIDKLEATLNESSAAGWDIYSVSAPILQNGLWYVLVTLYKAS